MDDENFWKILQARTSNTSTRLSKERELIFYQVETREALQKIRTLQDYLEKNGAIWVVTPKGKQHIKQTDVIEAAKQVSLVDVKVVSFSETHTALKLVIPLSRR